MLVDILTPALSRPGRVEPLVKSLRASVTCEPHGVREFFLCTAGDDAELTEIDRCGYRKILLPGPRAPGDYSRKINFAATLSSADWLFMGADDLHFHPGWLSACLRLHNATGALVIGTNDLGNPLVRIGRHATHSLVHRDYLAQGTIDEASKLLHEGYDHNGADVEFVETAIFRQTWAFAADAHVEHLHPLWKKGVTDATYALGQADYLQDIRLLRSRNHLWQHDEVMRMLRRSRRQVTRRGREIRLR